MFPTISATYLAHVNLELIIIKIAKESVYAVLTYNIMKLGGEWKVYLYAFLTSALDRDEKSSSYSNHFAPGGEKPLVPNG